MNFTLPVWFSRIPAKLSYRLSASFKARMRVRRFSRSLPAKSPRKGLNRFLLNFIGLFCQAEITILNIIFFKPLIISRDHTAVSHQKPDTKPIVPIKRRKITRYFPISLFNSRSSRFLKGFFIGFLLTIPAPLQEYAVHFDSFCGYFRPADERPGLPSP